MFRRGSRLVGVAVAFLVLVLAKSLPAQDAVDPVFARALAAQYLIEKVAFDAPFVEEWGGATLGEEMLFFDPNGEPLRYEFKVTVARHAVGHIEVAANPVLGTTVLALQAGNRKFNVHESLDIALSEFIARNPDVDVISVDPAAVSPSVIAAMITFQRYRSEPEVEFVDLATLIPIPPDDASDPGPSRIFSTLDLLTQEQRDRNVEAYNGEFFCDAYLAYCLWRWLKVDPLLTQPVPAQKWPWIKMVMEFLQIVPAQQHILPLHRLRLIEQETPIFCARATAQMVMWFHYGQLYHSQTQIDSLMKAYGWPNSWRYAMKRYYTKDLTMPLSSYDADVALDKTDSTTLYRAWNNMKSQLNGGWPFVDGVPHHARMAMGYRVRNKAPGLSLFEVAIYDPGYKNSHARWEVAYKETSFGLSRVAPRYFLLNVKQ